MEEWKDKRSKAEIRRGRKEAGLEAEPWKKPKVVMPH